MSNKSLIRELNSGAAWMKSQADLKNGGSLTRAENLIVTALIVLSSSPDWGRYRAGIKRRRMIAGIRKRKECFTTKRWSKEFSRLIRWAASDLECLPGRVITGTPLGPDKAPTHHQKRMDAIRDQKGRFTVSGSNHTGVRKGAAKSTEKPEEFRPRIATFGKAVVFGNERSAGFLEVTT